MHLREECPDFIQVKQVKGLKHEYVVFDDKEKKVLDDAQGFGYRTPEKALQAYYYMSNHFQKIKHLAKRKYNFHPKDKKAKKSLSKKQKSKKTNNKSKNILNEIKVVRTVPNVDRSVLIIKKSTGEIIDDNYGQYYASREEALAKFKNKTNNYKEWPKQTKKKHHHKKHGKFSKPESQIKKMKITLNEEQEEAFNLVESGANVFISGSAGTGKSILLDYILQHDLNKETRVCAPTGIAAINVEGTTIHKLLNLNPKVDLIFGHPRTMPEDLENVDRVIVDEISMCRSDLFNWLSKCLKMAEKINNKPIQLIVVGDFCQLPPVVAGKVESERFSGAKKYAFTTEAWKSWNFKPVILHKVMRQQDKDYIEALNKIRLGDASGIDYISRHIARSEQKNAITLTSRNRDADEINLAHLNKINTKTMIFESKVEGQVGYHDKPVPDRIVLKKGAQIISMVNDGKERYQNGSIGKIIKFVENKDHQQCIVAQFENRKALIQPYTWSVYEYLPSEDNPKHYVKTLVGQYTQIPVKLGYAITIHKSQGQTYDRVNAYPAGWLSGLLYVTLSRTRKISNLFLKSFLSKDMVYTDPAILEFYKNLS